MMKLKDIAGLIKGSVEGDNELEIKGIGKIESAGSDEITFISNPKYEKYFNSTSAAAVILSDEFDIKTGRENISVCLLYTSPSPRDRTRYRMPSSA